MGGKAAMCSRLCRRPRHGRQGSYVLAHNRPELLSKLVLVIAFCPAPRKWIRQRGREREYIAAQIRTWSHRKDAISDATIAEYARHYATPDGMTAGFNYYRALRTDIPYVETLRSKKIAVPVLTIAGR
jgi:pimeloyl-ACP methyl ester carboxylesterase